MTLFLWCAFLLFLIRSSSVIFSNFAETAFLKRYGVEYLPAVQIVYSLTLFFIMGLMTGLTSRLPSSRLLGYMCIFCGFTVAGFRLFILISTKQAEGLPFGFELIYPVLYILNRQFEVLLAMVFWNLANDLFNTRQSKRLMPLITAGGVIGRILISLDSLISGHIFLNSSITPLRDFLFPPFLSETSNVGYRTPILLTVRAPIKMMPG